MAIKKISEFPQVTEIKNEDLILIEQDGVGKYATIEQLKSLLGNDGSITFPTEWTPVPDMGFGTSHIHDICYADGKFVAIGSSYKISYSEDGINWTAVTNRPFTANDANAICYGNGKFVVIGSAGKTAYSEDGINWSGDYGGSGVMTSLCYGNGKFIFECRNCPNLGSWCAFCVGYCRGCCDLSQLEGFAGKKCFDVRRHWQTSNYKFRNKRCIETNYR